MLLDISPKSDYIQLPMTSESLVLHRTELEINDPKLVVQFSVLFHTKTKHSNQLLLVPLISVFFFETETDYFINNNNSKYKRVIQLA